MKVKKRMRQSFQLIKVNLLSDAETQFTMVIWKDPYVIKMDIKSIKNWQIKRLQMK